jgi:hypothetical protein
MGPRSLGDRVQYAKRLLQALKPNGRLAIVDFQLDSPEGPPVELRLEAQAIMADLSAAGFRATLVPETLPYQYIVVGER